MTPAERRDRMREAARLVSEVIASLRPDAHSCDKCGRVTFGNWLHHLTAKGLDGIRKKLLDYAHGFGDEADEAKEAGR